MSVYITDHLGTSYVDWFDIFLWIITLKHHKYDRKWLKYVKIGIYAHSGQMLWGTRSFYSLGTITTGFSTKKGFRNAFSTTNFLKMVLFWTILVCVCVCVRVCVFACVCVLNYQFVLLPHDLQTIKR